MTPVSLVSILGLCVLGVCVSALEYTTNGAGGEVCGKHGKTCIAGKAHCDAETNSCKCNEGQGFGDIICYKGNTVRAEVVDDPDVHTYHDLSFSLVVPCRYPLSHTVTRLKDRSRQTAGSCEFQSFAFQQKSKGKFYLAGYDVAIRVTYTNSTEVLYSVRLYGTAYTGTYKFYYNATKGAYLPDGTWQNDPVDFYDNDLNLKIKMEFDDVNNLGILDVKKCGINFQFRPYDVELRTTQPHIPHLANSVNCAYHPDFHSLDKIVALPPPGEGISVDDVLLPGLDGEESMLVRALTTDAAQNAPKPNAACSVAGNALSQCSSSQLPSAMDSCTWIIKLPRFMTCYDKTESGYDIMLLFAYCVDVYCSGAKTCNDVISMITSSGCHVLSPPYTDVDNFVAGSVCPVP